MAFFPVLVRRGEVDAFRLAVAEILRTKPIAYRCLVRSRHILSRVMPDDRAPRIDVDDAMRDELATQLSAIARALPDRINADPERVEQGLARLVLTLIEVVRKVLEHQAVRRMDGGGLERGRGRATWASRS